MKNTCCIILAAGEGKRMKSDKPKVLSEVIFKPMLGWIMDTIIDCEISNICVVTGFKHEMVEDYLDKYGYVCKKVFQLERKGTAHAVKTAEHFLKANHGKEVLILAGDAPFIDKETIDKAYSEHTSLKNSVTLISSVVENPFGYGRILRDYKNCNVIGVVEEKDANESERKIKEVNSGAYWFSIDSLLKVLYNISNDTSQGEYYLTDAVKLLIKDGNKVGAVKSEISDVVLGANDCEQLSNINSIARKRIIKNFINNGVSIPCWDGVVIGKDVEIHKGCCILPGTIILGKSKIMNDCIIGPNSQIFDCYINCGSKINSSYCVNSNVLCNQNIGPFASIINNEEQFKTKL